jgi:hypothetical protein
MSAATGLEVAIALSFLYLIFSLVISRINEAVAALLDWRANTLEMGLRQLLTGQVSKQKDTDAAEKAPADVGEGVALAKQLLDLSQLKHPLVDHLHPPKLFGRGTRRPSYLDPKLFSGAMLDILAPERPAIPDAIQLTDELRRRLENLATQQPAAAAALRDVLPPAGQALSDQARERFRQELDRLALSADQEQPLREVLFQLTLGPNAPLAQVVDSINKLGDHPLRKSLLILVQDAAGNLDRFRLNLEGWFNQAMERVSGFYKRKVQLALLVYALLLVLLLNVDTVTLGRTLWTNGVLRQAVVAAAGQQDNQTPSNVAETLRKVTDLNLPLGWASAPAGDPRHLPTTLGGWLLKLLGLLLTVIALSLGSEFWFQLLNKLINLRSTGPPPPTDQEEPTRPVAVVRESG